ncbi:MAG: hypothetical protein KJ964_10905 [Verrucomicrobia bacterium]|nr:hypothetical protein [Verrucomicrobiota bacterium]MBU1735400.1 hypothetical protein [Verrucomicrobiota bacterium]MBU1857445.1 hypothetical protein [Verrucomicrobiota bacterium]
MTQLAAPLATRELYCPSHFGNTYEATLPGEMTDLLAEAKFWGFNRFSDWFDTIDLYNVYEKKHKLFNMPEAIWARKFSNFKCADKLGFELGLVVSPNHVFSNQVTPENEAEKTGKFFGQLVCPSKPGATELILNNYRKLFQDFKERGLRLGSIGGGAYDYGGCACEKCSPWIVTFGKLFKQIAELAEEFFGSISVELWGWWWTDEDHQEFTKWADAEAPDYFKAMSFHLPYGVTDYQVCPIPRNCAEKAFVHIAYGEKSGHDAYCHFGANIAPVRLEKTVKYLVSRGAAGFLAYSEGDHDDINKAILAGLASKQYSSADEVLHAYAKRYFGTNPAGWSELLHYLGDFETIETVKCRRLFDKLSRGVINSWRFQQIEERLKMAEAHRAVLAETDWTQKRLAAARAFIASKERLYRNVWRLGLQRHAFRFETYMPDWYDSFIKMSGEKKFESSIDVNAQA